MTTPTATDPNDRIRIDVSQELEVHYWTEELGVTKEQLVAAVIKAGPVAKDVRRELSR